MTFEKILDVFHDYLQQDPLYEVVQTSHGYTLMDWEPMRKEWYRAILMDTPEKLLDALLCAYADFLSDRITGSERELTVEECSQVNSKCAEIKRKCIDP